MEILEEEKGQRESREGENLSQNSSVLQMFA